MINSLLTKFPPGYTPNESQSKILRRVHEAFKTHKFVVVNAPTGAGKSFISKTLGNNASQPSDKFVDLITTNKALKRSHLGGYAHADECMDEPAFGAYALTITKALQDQYKQLFTDTAVMKGKSNYQCTVDDRFTVDIAPCLIKRELIETCQCANACPYYNARNETLVAQFATLNYDMFFALPAHVKRKQYIICDEASELEDQIVKLFSVSIDYKFLKRCGIIYLRFPNENHELVRGWASVLSSSIADKVDQIQKQLKDKTAKAAYIASKKVELTQLRTLGFSLNTMLDTWMESEYLYENTVDGVQFTPLKIDKLSHHLFDHAEKVVLMSATIIDPAKFCEVLGITDYEYIEAESVFDPKNAPIYVKTTTKLNFSNLRANLPTLTRYIEQICAQHKGEKGLIHTHTNVVTEYLRSHMKGSRFLYREPGVRNEEILEAHYNTNEPTVLVSPSMSYGVDLKGDLARFQIIIKAPFLPLTEKRVERISKADFNWYMNRMLCSLIQSTGRGIRSPNDYCATYILDGAIAENVIKYRKRLPKYFIDRFA